MRRWIRLASMLGLAFLFGATVKGKTSSFEKVLKQSADHWAFQPIRSHDVPTSSEKQRAIDTLVHSRLSSEKIESAQPANRKTLIRRLYHDLHGLNPSFEQIQAFIDDSDPQAYAKLVDRLLASPRFGERWGRHWLDVARYADTKGYLAGGESRAYPFAYTYRDWVIKALNEDLPYDDFIRKQLAADFLVDSPNHPDLAALGFLTAGPRFLNRRQLIIDDRIDLVTRGLMGFTVSCARCHDHFHDPVPQEDYYSLYGIFDLSSQPKSPPLIGNPDPDSPLHKEFEVKLKKLESEVDKHLRSNLDYVRSKKGLVSYLQLCADGFNLPVNEFEALAAKRKLYPKFANRWRSYLTEKDKAKQSFLKPLLSLLTAKNHQSVLKSWQKGNDSTFPAFLRAKLKQVGAKDRNGVLDWYAEAIFRAIKEASLGKEKKGLVHAITANGFPCNLKMEEIEKYFDTKARNKTNQLRAKVEKHKAEHPGSPPRAMVLEDKKTIRDPYVLLRGNLYTRGEKVPRRFLAVLSPTGADRKKYSRGSGRLELAESILAPENPLTARVMANRIWAHLFGKGLVRTPSDFGLMGERPTHPELLDYLASRFRTNGWKVKSLIREITLSQTYRRSSQANDQNDPENRLLATMNPKRLGYEAMRDCMLQASGELDLKMGGPSQKLLQKPYSKRRAVYGYVDRQNIAPILSTFDFANPNIHAPKRVETTVPQQALYALNDPFVIERAKRLANLARSEEEAEKLVRFLYRKTLSRDPNQQELATTLAFLGPQAPLAKVEDLAQALLISNEFFFVD